MTTRALRDREFYQILTHNAVYVREAMVGEDGREYELQSMLNSPIAHK